MAVMKPMIMTVMISSMRVKPRTGSRRRCCMAASLLPHEQLPPAAPQSFGGGARSAIGGARVADLGLDVSSGILDVHEVARCPVRIQDVEHHVLAVGFRGVDARVGI